ncbi:MAG: hypothetical protein GX799_11750 [Crenarchaeota archaeon]|jgi:hypothetical protein|nr:hypothetical protein [Thermoproteota archaeon]
MANKRKCVECNAPLKRDEVALSIKILGLNVTNFYCIACLAEIIDCDQDDLTIKIQEFKEQGCTMFL